jgi:hypothetical protein
MEGYARWSWRQGLLLQIIVIIIDDCSSVGWWRSQLIIVGRRRHGKSMLCLQRYSVAWLTAEIFRELWRHFC